MQNRQKKKTEGLSRIKRRMREFKIPPGCSDFRPDGTEKIYHGGVRYTKEELYVTKFYRTEEVARKLKISKNQIYKILGQGISAPEIAYGTTKQLRFSQSDIDEILKYSLLFDDIDICDQNEIPDDFVPDDCDQDFF
jgi:predicted DNA-binding transcriptional regulator AlpA